MHFEKAKSGSSTGNASSKGETATACATTSQGAQVAVAVVPVQVWCTNASKPCTVNAILDPGSTATFVTSNLVEQLGLHSTESSLNLTTMTANDKMMATQVVTGVKVADVDGNNTLTLPPAYTIDTMPYAQKDLAGERDVKAWPHLQEVPFNWRWSDAKVQLLIGMNCPDALKPVQVIDGGAQKPYAVQTLLGWCVNGPLKRGKSSAATVNLIRAEHIQSMLHKMHQSDFDNVYDFETKAPSQEDREWLEKVSKSTVKLGNGRYEIALPFRDRPPKLRDNREQAMQRLTALKKRFAKDEQFHRDYIAFMGKMESEGYVEEVALAAPASLTSYVPHHGVYHPRKPGKIRVVFNCSSKYKDVSLNDCLLPGPDLTSSLLGVLIRFRQERVAFMADIEAMFYQVQVPRDDRDTLRYLWWPGGDVNREIKTYRMKVHLFGAASSPSCANFALRRAAEDALAAKVDGVDEEVCESVRQNFYVDDCLKSVPTEEAAIRVAMGLRAACASGGFRLTKFISTSKRLLRAMPESELAKELHNIPLDDDKNDPLGALKQERALGVCWDVAADVFQISTLISGKAECDKATKRSVLAVLSAVYDPMGIVAPFVIVARILFRNLTKDMRMSWDESLSTAPEASRQWKAWVDELPSLQQITLPRCFKTLEDEGTWQLHVFCDASLEAFSAVVYLRHARREQEAEVIFVVGKARVSPPKVVTIPRLELTAAKLASEIAATVQRELQYNIEKRVFWSDSQTVLKYLDNKVRRFHTFVANRVCSILSNTNLEEWRYVPTTMNPADEGSRGASPEELKNGLWLKGPSFLRQAEDQWPKRIKHEPVDACDPEVHTLATVTKDKGDPSFMESLAARYSSMSRLRRAVGIWKSFITHLKGSRRVTVDPQEAERLILACVQREYWLDEWRDLESGIPLKKTSPLYKLQVHMKEGLMRLGSRVRTSLPIVPGSTWVAELIVKEAHAMQMHFGRQATASQALKTHWIVGLNKLVRKVIRECPSCQRRTAQPTVPRMAELPDFRINATRAFEITGVDYFGPFLVKKARTEHKTYGVIFTCAVTRAVHLEVAENLSTNAFLNALRRFIARRGHVKQLISDNGTNFVGAEAALTIELKKELKHLQTKDQATPIERWLSQKGIKWSFNPPGASHHGGFWERLIRSVRKALGVVLPERRPLTYDGIVTVMCEVEAVLNNRPLTPVSEDVNDYEALTPNHLLLGMAGPTVPPGNFTRATIPLKRQWRQVQHVANCFWKRWLVEYRVLLHQRTKWHADSSPLKINDVVLVIDPVRPRDYWPLGRIVLVHPGKDGRVRVITVQTVKGSLRRPVSKVCKLEAASESNM